jgi:hypothetical protein
MRSDGVVATPAPSTGPPACRKPLPESRFANPFEQDPTMTTPSPSNTPSKPDSRRADENRTTHNQSVNTDATPSADGSAQPRPEPQLPHDIDESAHSQQSASASHAGVGNQAYADAVGPSQDTDKGPVTDALYNGKVAPDRGETPPRQ